MRTGMSDTVALSDPGGLRRCNACRAPLPAEPPAHCPACGAAVEPGGDTSHLLTLTVSGMVKAITESQLEGPVSGPQASLSRAGLEGGITLEPNRSRGAHTRPVSEILGTSPSEAKYVLAGEVGRGGMGLVLRAVDRDLRRDVAMKLLQSGLDATAVERFVHEAQIAGQLEHPNIVPVHELGVDASGRPFFTMKLVKGRSLAELIRASGGVHRQVSLRRHLGVFINACNAIAFAHDRGVIHRDLKPANIMVGDFGEVLVMDWGLAKLTRGQSGTRRIVPTEGGIPVAPNPKATDERLATLVRSFASGVIPAQADGGRAVEGTPAYMPPEQAQGYLSEIDERSDIYSLGAILYEILTGRPPVTGKNLRGILDAVIAHKIIPPEERAPHRAIPRELAAIAMKALMRDKADRYQTVLEFTHDIELFLEDRSVSAKEDTTWEALVKLVRRNQEVAIAIGVSSLIVAIVTVMLITALVKERHRFQDAAQKAENGLADLKREQQDRQSEQKRAAPALVAKARQDAEAKDFANARADAELAVHYDPSYPEAHLLVAQLYLREKNFLYARRSLAEYLQLRGGDVAAAQLADLCSQASGDTGSSADLAAIADLIAHQGSYSIAESLLQSGREMVRIYRLRLDKAWPGCTNHGFSVDADGQLTLHGLAGRTDVSDLSPLAGMPIEDLKLDRTQVLDLAPLKGMPLTRLSLADTPVRSIDPLAGLPLVHLKLSRTRVEDLAPLRGSAIEDLDISDTPVADLGPLQGIRLTSLRLGLTNVVDLGPLNPVRLTLLHLPGTQVTDLTPIANAPLTDLDIGGTNINTLAALSSQSRLAILRIGATPISDLRPLAGLPLRLLALGRTQVTDLEPLQGMPLSELSLIDTRITDLAPLARLPLTVLDLSRTAVINLEPIAKLPLTRLILDGTRVEDISDLAGMPLTELSLAGTRVKDLRPLTDERGPGLRLERLVLPPNPGPTLERLRRLPSLANIGESWVPPDMTRLPTAKMYWASRKVPGP